MKNHSQLTVCTKTGCGLDSAHGLSLLTVPGLAHGHSAAEGQRGQCVAQAACPPSSTCATSQEAVSLVDAGCRPSPWRTLLHSPCKLWSMGKCLVSSNALLMTGPLRSVWMESTWATGSPGLVWPSGPSKRLEPMTSGPCPGSWLLAWGDGKNSRSG